LYTAPVRGWMASRERWPHHKHPALHDIVRSQETLISGDDETVFWEQKGGTKRRLKFRPCQQSKAHIDIRVKHDSAQAIGEKFSASSELQKHAHCKPMSTGESLLQSMVQPPAVSSPNTPLYAHPCECAISPSTKGRVRIRKNHLYVYSFSVGSVVGVIEPCGSEGGGGGGGGWLMATDCSALSSSMHCSCSTAT